VLDEYISLFHVPGKIFFSVGFVGVGPKSGIPGGEELFSSREGRESLCSMLLEESIDRRTVVFLSETNCLPVARIDLGLHPQRVTSKQRKRVLLQTAIDGKSILFLCFPF
jgi:hypothetical protein